MSDLNVDLNALLSYSLSINFAPLQAHLRASGEAQSRRAERDAVALRQLAREHRKAVRVDL